MTFETTLALIALVGIVLAVGAQAYGISSWLLFAFGCIPAAVVLALAAWEVSTPCDHRNASRAVGVLFLLALLSSMTVYAGAALAGVIDGLRWAKARGYGKALSYLACPLACVLGGGLVLYAALAVLFHCYES
jgi:hypothetical protein